MRIFSFIAVLCLVSTGMSAEQSLSLSLGISPESQTSSLLWNPRWQVLDFGSLSVGTGLRTSAYFGQEIALETAEHDLIEAQETTKLSPIDPLILATNLVFSLEGKVFEAVEIGFNIDFLGVSYGTSRRASVSNGEAEVLELLPSRLNALLGNTRDLGTLNSEFYLGYRITNTYRLRLGLTHFFAEMVADDRAKADGQRFRVVNNLGMIAIDYLM